MDLSKYSDLDLTLAINALPPVPTIIRSTGLFKPEPMKTVAAKVSMKDDKLTLVPAMPRGGPGTPVEEDGGNTKYFEAVHLPQDDVVRADDVQDLREFGTNRKVLTTPVQVNNKLVKMRRKIDYTREHLQLGAIQGKLIDSTGKVLIDVNKEFGVTHKTKNIAVSNDATDASAIFDEILGEQEDLIGDMFDGFYLFASPEFMTQFMNHKSMKDIYKMYREASVYRDGKAREAFQHGGANFIRYSHKFNSDADIKPGEAKLVPKGLADAFIEFFAPADMEGAVNTMGLPFYVSKEPLKHKKGTELHAQSNPLPINLNPKSVLTLKLT